MCLRLLLLSGIEFGRSELPSVCFSTYHGLSGQIGEDRIEAYGAVPTAVNLDLHLKESACDHEIVLSFGDTLRGSPSSIWTADQTSMHEAASILRTTATLLGQGELNYGLSKLKGITGMGALLGANIVSPDDNDVVQSHLRLNLSFPSFSVRMAIIGALREDSNLPQPSRRDNISFKPLIPTVNEIVESLSNSSDPPDVFILLTNWEPKPGQKFLLGLDERVEYVFGGNRIETEQLSGLRARCYMPKSVYSGSVVSHMVLTFRNKQLSAVSRRTVPPALFHIDGERGYHITGEVEQSDWPGHRSLKMAEYVRNLRKLYMREFMSPMEWSLRNWTNGRILAMYANILRQTPPESEIPNFVVRLTAPKTGHNAINQNHSGQYPYFAMSVNDEVKSLPSGDSHTEMYLARSKSCVPGHIVYGSLSELYAANNFSHATVVASP